MRSALLALLSTCLTVACASPPSTQPLAQRPAEGEASVWVGSLNSRGGSAHGGQWRLDLVQTGETLTGSYRHPGDACLEVGAVSGTLRGGELLATAGDSSSLLEIKALPTGGDLYGVYRFASGPCAGDWGSLIGRRGAEGGR